MPLLILGTNNDDEYAQLVALGYSGSLNDMQFKYLSSLGYTGSLADKIFSHLTQPVVSLSVSASSIVEGQSQGTTLLTFTPQNASNPSDVTLSGVTPSNAVQMNADGVTLEAGSYTLTFSTDIAVTFTASFTDDNGSYDFPITIPVAQNGVPVGGPFDLTFDVTADETPPSISSTSPADNATDVAVDAAITITFSEPIAFGTGNIILRENNSGWSDLETFDVTTDVGTSPGQVSISGNTLTIKPTSNRSNSLEYAIRIDSGAITDIGGVAFAGITDDTSFSFTTVAASAGITIVGTAINGVDAGADVPVDISGISMLDGDRIIAFGGGSSGVSTAVNCLTAGFTRIAGDLTASDTYRSNFSVFEYVVSGTPPTTVTFDPTYNSTGAGAGGVFVLRGVDPSTPLDQAISIIGGSNTAYADAPAQTPGSANALIVVVGFCSCGPSTPSPYTGPSNMTGFEQASGVGSSRGGTAFMAFKTDPTNGVSFDPAPLTAGTDSTSQSWVAATITFKAA